MKTYMAKPAEVERKWYVVDATDMVLGRLASQVAMVLRGKNKPTFTPNVDTGDYVIIINADKVRLTGKNLKRNTTVIIRVTSAASKKFNTRNLWPKNPNSSYTKPSRVCFPKTLSAVR